MPTTLSLDLGAIQATHGNPKPMGLGEIGTGNIIFKRKFRWTMEIEYCTGTNDPPKVVAKEFVKVGARPQIDIEEQEINYLHGKMWIPGKATWQTMTVTWYDVAGKSASGVSTNSIFGWIASVYDITDSTFLFMGSRLSDYEGVGRIILWDGCGEPLEAWLLRNMWPQSVNFGDLDMSSSEEVTIEMTLRFANAEYVSFCPPGTLDKCPCTPCSQL